MSAPVPVLWRGDLYPSISAAARAANVAREVMWRAYCRGTADRAGMGDRGPRAAVPVVWRGVDFPSLNACASHLRRHTKTIRKHWRAGTLDSLERRE